MHRFVKIAYLLGGALMILGLFSQSWRSDRLSICDENTFLMVVLGLMLLQVFKPAHFLLKPTVWNIFFAVLLAFVTLSLPNLQMLWIDIVSPNFSIEIGQWLTVCSSIFLLIVAVIHYRKIGVYEDNVSTQILAQGPTAEGYKISFALGLTLCVLGSISLIGWLQSQRDFYNLPVNVMVLGFWLALLIFIRLIQSVHLLFKPGIWYVLICVGLLLVSGYSLVKYLSLSLFNDKGTIIGLLVFVAGALLAFITAIQYARNPSQDGLASSKAATLIDVKIACVIGTILTIYYSFFPLWTRGDLAVKAYCAVQSVHCLTLLDSEGNYGGYVFILFSVAILILAFQPRPPIWSLLMASGIVLIAGYYFSVFWMVNHGQLKPYSSAGPFLERGFVLWMLGAGLLWVAALTHYNRPFNAQLLTPSQPASTDARQ